MRLVLVDTIFFLLWWILYLFFFIGHTLSSFLRQWVGQSVSGEFQIWRWITHLWACHCPGGYVHHLETRWIHNGCWWTKVLHSEVSMMIKHHQYPWTKVIVLKGLTDQVMFYFVFLLQERSNANIWYWFCRKGQTSWSDANTRCQSEGDDSLAIIT